jgi:hypothetical protein
VAAGITDQHVIATLKAFAQPEAVRDKRSAEARRIGSPIPGMRRLEILLVNRHVIADQSARPIVNEQLGLATLRGPRPPTAADSLIYGAASLTDHVESNRVPFSRIAVKQRESC